MVLMEIVKQLNYRYLSVIKKDWQNQKSRGKFIRYYQGYKIDLLKESLERIDVLNDTTAKLYFDLATYKDENGNLPLFSFEQSKREQQRINFSGVPSKNIEGKYKSWIKSYDFAIDIDNKDVMKSWEDAKKVKEVFDTYKLPYSVRFSGSKGFHFVIDSKWIELEQPVLQWADIFGGIVQNLSRDEFGEDEKGDPLGSIDFSIYDPRRVLKIAYSLVNKNEKEYVVLPLSEEQFNNFKLENMELASVLKNCQLFKRGILERNHGLTEQQLKRNVSDFFRDYGY